MSTDLNVEITLPQVVPQFETLGSPVTERDLFAELSRITESPHSSVLYHPSEQLHRREAIVGVRYTPEILLVKGADSHMVFGVKVRVRNNDGTEEEVDGVAKKHPNPRNAQKEFDKNSLVFSQGIRTTKPLGYIARESSFFIGEFDKYLLSGDRVAWSDLTRPENISELQRFFSSLATTVARLHNLGIYHLDMQIKNTALDKLSGEAYIYDWESAVISREESQERDLPIRIQSLRTLLMSVYDQKTLRSHFFGPFGDSRSHHFRLSTGESYLNLAEKLLFYQYKEKGELLGDFEIFLKEQGYNIKELFSEQGTAGVTSAELMRDAISKKLKRVYGIDIRLLYFRSKAEGRLREFWRTFENTFLNKYLADSSLPDDKQKTLASDLQASLRNKISSGGQKILH